MDVASAAMRALIAIDGSAPAGLAVDLASDIAWPAGSELLVAEAIEFGPAWFGGAWPDLAVIQTDRLEAEVLAEADRTVQDARSRLARPNLSVEAAVLRGRPAMAIVDRARDMRADLIIVGSLGHGAIETMLLGSVSAEVIDHAPAPVLVVRGRSIKHIVVGWDGSSCASRAADVVRTWPIFAGSDVRVVSVAGSEIPWWTGFPESGSPDLLPIYLETADASRRHYDQLAHEMTAQLQAAGRSAEAERREGDAATELLAAARESQADLIVIGTHGRTGLARLVLGSVARNVLQHASCSVLVVREGSWETKATK
jgi:nucleotide-binding universal stress UspA family protein